MKIVSCIVDYLTGEKKSILDIYIASTDKQEMDIFQSLMIVKPSVLLSK